MEIIDNLMSCINAFTKQDFKIQVNAFAKKNNLIIWKMRCANLAITLGIIIYFFKLFTFLVLNNRIKN